MILVFGNELNCREYSIKEIRKYVKKYPLQNKILLSIGDKSEVQNKISKKSSKFVQNVNFYSFQNQN